MGERNGGTPPLISIVVPVYNGERFLIETLRSIRNQTETRWECVIVDDGSSDGSLALAQAFARGEPRMRVVAQANAGASAARNAGFRATHCGSEWVSFMDSDDVWSDQALARLLVSAETAPDVIGSHGLADFIGPDGLAWQPGSYAARGRDRLGLRGRRLVRVPLSDATDFSVLINGNVLFPPGLILARRGVYQRVGPFDTNLRAAEDWDMLIRLSRHGALAFIDQVLLGYRRHDDNLGAKEGVAQQAWRVRCKAFYSPENSPDQTRGARQGWRAYQRRLARENAGLFWPSVRSRNLRAACWATARTVVYLARAARGRPLPRVASIPAESW